MTRRKMKELYGEARVDRRALIANAAIFVIGLLLILLALHTMTVYGVDWQVQR